MKVFVQSATVSRNIDHFKEAACKFLEQKSTQDLLKKKGIQGLVHCATGEIYFGESVEGGREYWKKIFLRLTQEGDFLVIGVDETAFSVNDLSSEAYQAMVETVHTINLLLQLLQGRLELESLLEHLKGMEVQLSKDIIHEAWHQVDRIGAEALLDKEPAGSYLFRKDEYAAILETQLRQHFQIPIKCITLSYLNSKKRVVDLTLVKRDEVWIIYDDDPSIEGQVYPEIYSLLESLQGALTLPLLS